MTSTLLKAPALLAPGEGESFPMLTHSFTIKVSAQDTKGEWVMYEIADTLGNGAPLHSHPWDEAFYVLEGELAVQIGNQKMTAIAGSSMFVPAGVAHGFSVSSPTVRFLATISPATAAEAFYREMGEKVADLASAEPAVLEELCQKHRLQIF
ncbi:MAG: cupin domain-containing protein [Scytolyngbya sp. HA4215-MV1]|jgi:quercetin dioxygenase-like cupin family protein|nr:cupin domain-containing protein [Scytolyngbya sp. HA4215-MV1]